VNPCGRLPESFPIKLEDNPSFLSYGGEGNVAVYTEGVFVGYRYYDKKKMDVLFPFGYGLSYTSFEYSNLTVSAEQIKDTDTLTVTVDVTNTGSLAGKEVVQLYVGDKESEVFRPVRELKGFEKVALAPGETKTVTFTLEKRAFAYWNTTIHDWYVESGDFTIEIGRSSRDIVLVKDVYVEGTTQLPRAYTVDSIFMDLMKDEKAMAVLKPMMEGGAHVTEESNTTEAADEAITKEMAEAMMMYNPLRMAVNFGGNISYDELAALVDQINNG